MAGRPSAKPLLPTLKEKKRYIAYEIHAEGPLPSGAGRLLVSGLQERLGSFGAAAAGLMPVLYDEGSSKGVVRCSLKESNNARRAMLLITSLGRREVMVRPLLTSGILRKAKQAM